MRKFGKKAVGALKKVGSSSHSRSWANVHEWDTPPSSHDDAPTETHEEEVESQASEWQAPTAPQGQVPDNSHLVIQGNRENQTYNMLKNRVFNHTHGFNDKLLEKTGMEVDFARVCKNVGWTSFANVSELGCSFLGSSPRTRILWMKYSDLWWSG